MAKTTKGRKATKRTNSRKATATTRGANRSKGTARGKAKTKAAGRAAKRPSPKVAKKKTAARAAATRSRKSAPEPQEPGLIAKTAATAKGIVAGAVSAVARRLPGGKTELDAIELLEQEHRQFERLLKEGEESTERAKKGRKELLATLIAGLNAHELMEEKVLYPALQSHPEAREIVLEGFEEHHVADVIAAELKEVATDDEQWGAKFKVMKENIEHHIQEEEGEMFRTARGIFSKDELLDLAERMREVRPKR